MSGYETDAAAAWNERLTAEQVAANPHLDDCRRMQFFLIFDVRKPASVRS